MSYKPSAISSYICILMADVHTKEIRSKNMAAIKGKNTKPECWCAAFYMPMVSGINCMIKPCRAKMQKLIKGNFYISL